jgi:hypothetical protein
LGLAGANAALESAAAATTMESAAAPMAAASTAAMFSEGWGADGQDGTSGNCGRHSHFENSSHLKAPPCPFALRPRKERRP